MCQSLLGVLIFRPYIFGFFYFFPELIWMESFPEFLVMESACNAWGPLKILHWAASKVMVDFVVKIKVLCSEIVWKGRVLGGSLCLLARSRDTGRALDLPWEPARQCEWAVCSRVGMQDSGFGQAVNQFLKLRWFPFLKDFSSTGKLRIRRDKLIFSSTTRQQCAKAGFCSLSPNDFKFRIHNVFYIDFM